MHPADFNFFLKNVQNITSIAPELTINKVPTIKTPLYSFGVIVYRLISLGQYPIPLMDIRKLRDRYKNKDYSIELPEDLDTIKGEAKFKPVLYGLLTVDPHERISYVDLQEFML